MKNHHFKSIELSIRERYWKNLSDKEQVDKMLNHLEHVLHPVDFQRLCLMVALHTSEFQDACVDRLPTTKDSPQGKGIT